MTQIKERPFCGYKGKRIVVTGSAGYLATALIEALSGIECSIVRFCRPESTLPSAPSPTAAQIEDIHGDIRDRKIWAEMLGNVDFIFHFAAQTSVYAAAEDPFADMEINLMPMLYILEVCKRKGYAPAIVFAGTSTECGIPTALPVNERHQDNPVTIYDVHKLTAEKYLLCYVRNGIVKGATLRLTNVYGPGPLSSSPDRGVLNLMVRKALNGEQLTIYGGGEYLRDYVFIDDVIKSFWAAGEEVDSINGNYYIIGSGKGICIAEMVNLVADMVSQKKGCRAEVIHVPPPHRQSIVESRDFVADISNFSRKTGWSPQVSLIEGIERTIDYYCRRLHE